MGPQAMGSWEHPKSNKKRHATRKQGKAALLYLQAEAAVVFFTALLTFLILFGPKLNSKRK